MSTCPNCHIAFDGVHVKQIYCSYKCKKACEYKRLSAERKKVVPIQSLRPCQYPGGCKDHIEEGRGLRKYCAVHRLAMSHKAQYAGEQLLERACACGTKFVRKARSRGGKCPACIAKSYVDRPTRAKERDGSGRFCEACFGMSHRRPVGGRCPGKCREPYAAEELR